MANILIKMAEIRDLTPSERHVVEYILDHYKEVCSMGIVELGESFEDYLRKYALH